MGKRGRPRKNGQQPIWMFLRVALVLHGYNAARSSRLKHSSAVREAVAFVQESFSGMPISETEVKRVLAEFQPQGVPDSLRITKSSEQTSPPQVTEEMGVPQGSKMRTVLTFGYGPRPKYPRI